MLDTKHFSSEYDYMHARIEEIRDIELPLAILDTVKHSELIVEMRKLKLKIAEIQLKWAEDDLAFEIARRDTGPVCPCGHDMHYDVRLGEDYSGWVCPECGMIADDIDPEMFGVSTPTYNGIAW